MFQALTVLLLMFLSVIARAEHNSLYNKGLVSIDDEYRAFKNYFEFDPKVLKLALKAYDCGVAAGRSNKQGLLTIVDYQLPSNQKRLWVLNLYRHRLVYNTYVAHGAGSGKVDATFFSNTVNSLSSSIGLYETGSNYSGQWGYAMRLYGLEPGFNSNAFKRKIVMHGGKYVSQNSVNRYGMIGMSHGCIVVPQPLDHKLINTIKNGSLIFTYYPSYAWLYKSKYLHCPILTRVA